MMEQYFSPAAPGVITIATCTSMKEAEAMLNWIQPVLDNWPRQTWCVWLVDALDTAGVRAARMGQPDQQPRWTDVDIDDFESQGAVCTLLGGKTGLIVLSPETIAQHVSSSLEGLVSALVSFPASDPLAKQFKQSFASFGVVAGI